MKKSLVMLLILMLVFPLTACGGTSTEGNNSDDQGPSGASSQQDEAAEEGKGENQNEETEEAKDENQNEETEEAKGENQEASTEFQEVVAVDNDQCTIKITEIDPDNLWGYTLKAMLENKSSDKTYMFAVETASINGVECDPAFATEVTAGSKSNNEINFTTDTLEENDIGDFTDIELTFRVHDSDDWLADPVANDTIHIYPYGEDKATVFVREPQDTDQVLVDNDACTAIVTGYEEDELWGYTVNLFLLNKTDQTVMFSVDDATVNGYMADPFFAHSVAPGKCAFTSMAWSDSIFEENSITEVNEISFLLRAHRDDLTGDDYVHENITLNP